jgi:hydrogenase-4 membrane subunit HyfE
MRRGSAQMKLSLDQKIAVSLLVFLIICLLVFWVLLEKPVQTPDGADEARNLQPILFHVRNALQVIRDARYVQPENQKLAEIVEDAVTRIDWALREILPGRITTHDNEGWKQRS